MISLLLVSVLSITGTADEGEQVNLNIRISATIVEVSKVSVTSTDLGIIGIDAERVVVVYSCGPRSGTTEFLLLHKPGSVEVRPVFASLDSDDGVISMHFDKDEMIAVNWNEARPVLASLYNRRIFMAWRSANKLHKAKEMADL